MINICSKLDLGWEDLYEGIEKKEYVYFLMKTFLFDFVTKEDESLSDLPVFSVSVKVFCCAVMSNNLYSHLKSETGWQQYTCEWGIHNLAFFSIPKNS